MGMSTKSSRTAKARAAVFAACWADPKYLALNALKDRLGKAWNIADAYHEPKAERLSKRLTRVNRAIGAFEDRALRAAGVAG